MTANWGWLVMVAVAVAAVVGGCLEMVGGGCKV